MKLTADQQSMFDGVRGWPDKLAMEMLVAVGRAYDAAELVPVRSVHLVIDGMALGAPGLRLLERLVDEGGRFVVPVTINAIAVDRRATDDADLTADQRAQLRMLEACAKLGCIASCSCNPFSQGYLPAFGETVAWSESATTPFVNAVLGGRTNREGATALASALTGLTPRYGMHLDSARKGTVLFDVRAPIEGLHRYNLLGALIGRRSADGVPVITGLDAPTRDELVGFCAAFAIHGSANMFHMVGITPEAPTLAAAMASESYETVTVDDAALQEEWRRTQTATRGRVDIVSIGCPHASLDQIAEVASLMSGRSIRDDVTFYIHTNGDVFSAATDDGLIASLGASGVRVTADNCAVVSYDRLPRDACLATNSAKMAFLADAVSGIDIRYGGLDDCVEAAVTGEWRGEAP